MLVLSRVCLSVNSAREQYTFEGIPLLSRYRDFSKYEKKGFVPGGDKLGKMKRNDGKAGKPGHTHAGITDS